MKNSVLPDFFGNMCAKYYWNWSAIDEKMYDFNLIFFFKMSDPTQTALIQMVSSNGCTTFNVEFMTLHTLVKPK